MRIGVYLARLDEVPPAESPIFTERERQYCLERRRPGPHLAARYAAKRAARAALGLPSDGDLEEVEVTRERGRAPTIRLHAGAAQAAGQAGVSRYHVSLTHSGDYAVALVVME